MGSWKLKYINYATLAVLAAACSANTHATPDTTKLAEVLINCDEKNNSYSFEFSNLTEFAKFSSFSLNNSSTPKTKLAEVCVLDNGITVETDFDLNRKSEYDGKGSLDSGRLYTLRKSPMDIRVMQNGKVVGNVIGVDFLKMLSLSVDAENIKICQTGTTKKHCDSYGVFSSAEPFNIRTHSIDIIN